MRTQGAALDRLGTQALAPAVYSSCTGRRPDAAGGWARAYEGGTSAQRKGGCCCCIPVGSPWADGILDWVASTAPPASTALPSRPPGSPAAGGDVWRNGPVRGPSRPRSVSFVRGVSHGAGAASITADSPTRKGLPARRPAAGRRAGPTIPSWGLEGRGSPSAAGLCPPPRPSARGNQSIHNARLPHSLKA